MMSAVKGYVKGSNIVIPENIDLIDGEEVIVVLKRSAEGRPRGKSADLSRFVMPTERGERADDYMREMRDNDRI